MLFNWLNANAANQCGTELARYFMEKMPVDTQKNEKKFAAKTS